MDTPALTPETLPVSSLGSPPHQQIKQERASSSSNNTMAVDHSSFFTKSQRPLSPPESPFNFGGAFAKPQSTAASAPASLHFELPIRDRRFEPGKQKLQRRRSPKRGEQKSGDNPYFPSIVEQESSQRWKRDSARLPQPSSPLAPTPLKSTPPTDEEAASTLQEEEDLAAAILDVDMSLSPLERRRTLKIRLPRRRTEEFPASPESLPSSSGTPPTSAQEYRRNMADYLEEIMRRKQTRWRMDGEDTKFSW